MRLRSGFHVAMPFLTGLVIISTFSISFSQTQTITPFAVPSNLQTDDSIPRDLDTDLAREFLGASFVAGALNRLVAEEPRARRGTLEEQVFRTVSPGVVYIETETSIGSGTLITPQGEILTNWHVIEGGGEILVGFVPDVGFELTQVKMFSARLVRYDQVTDLALLQLAEPAPQGSRVVSLGMPGSITIGSDVHAIGHPTGEAWTYTKGFVSQMRNDYEWITEAGLIHVADVVQTQTPINVGNSGGPLLDNSGNLVGVNAFKADGEGLNFAVSVTEVQDFLSRQTSRDAPRAQNIPFAQDECAGILLHVVRTEEDDGDVRVGDMDCNGFADIYELTPDNSSEPIFVFLDSDENEIPEAEIQDINRDGKWDTSLWDENEDGIVEVCGVHLDGDLLPSSYVNC